MGRLTAEPDYRTTQSGTALAKFTLAVERDYSGQNGERVTDFLDVDAWRQTADFVSRYFHKGQLVAVTGSVQVENYTYKNGDKRRSWSVQAQHCYFAEPKRDGQQQNGYNGYQQPYNGQQQPHNVNVAYEQQQQQNGYNGYQQPYNGQGGYQPQNGYNGYQQPYNGQGGYQQQGGQAQPYQGQGGYQQAYDDDDLPF